jgi:AraC-like DNA-binding protein
MIAAQAVLGLIRLNLQSELAPALLRTWFSLDLLLLLGVCCFLLLKALRQELVYDSMLVHERVRGKTPARRREVEAREARSVFARLDASIVEGQLYRKPRLSVDDLASRTGLQIKDISWAFNVGAKTSFNDYVNRLRVAAFRQLLEGPGVDKKSVLEMAFECGFNSKSSFNAIFKREVGMTPSQYLRSRGPTRGVTGEGIQA